MRFRSDPSRIRGSIAPVVTPFTADGALDHDGLRRLIEWQLDSGSHGISIGGSTGEPSAQTRRRADRRDAASSPRRSPTGCRSCRAPDRPSSTRRSSSPAPPGPPAPTPRW